MESIFHGNSEMARLMRSFDWANSDVGAPEQWSETLRTAVRICLASRHPIVLWWGKTTFTQFYNDAYISFLGAAKHPHFLGRSGKECWSEILPIIYPMWEEVFATGEATWSEDLLLVLNRNLPQEEGYFNFSYSALRNDDGSIEGIFCACYETTERVVGERRLRTLRDLGRTVAEAKTPEAACELTAKTLASNPADVPFALIYLLDSTARQAHLVARSGFEEDSAAAPRLIDLTATDSVWSLKRVFESASSELIHDLSKRFGELPGGCWSESPRSGIVLPIVSATQRNPTGFLVSAFSPRRVVDADYRSFFDLLANHLATAISNARAYEEERKRAEALAEIDRAKTTFFSNVSHEFRTPLTLMLGPLQDLLSRSQSHLSPIAKDQLELVNRNGARLLRLVNTLLDFSRIEAGRVQAVYQATDLAQFTSELASVFRSATEKAGLNLVVECDDLGEPVYVDRDMWEKIVLNLISNAFKFTFEGGIAVSVKRVDRNAQLRVRDTGVGIPADAIPRLFERFHRIPTTRCRTNEGSGIGLALVHELVKLHGGFLQVESEIGLGTTFIVSVPLGQTHLASGQVGGARSLSSTATGAMPYVEEALRWLPEASATAEVFVEHDEMLPVPCRQSSESEQRPRILFADDNADMRQYVSRLLGERYEVETAADGKAAFDMALSNPPSLILSDVMMPVLDGFEFLKAIRGDDRTRRIPIILLSARAGEESRVEGMQAGADDYLIKPFSARELLARVSARIEISRLQRENEKRVLDILETLSDGCYILDADCRFRYVNPAIKRMWAEQGINRDVLGEQVFEVFPDAKGTDFGSALMRAITERVPIEIESFYSPFQRWYVARYYPLPDGGVSTLVTDVTERKRSAILLRQAHEELEGRVRERTAALQEKALLLDLANDAIFVKSANGRISYWNEGATRLYGWTATEALGRSPVELLHSKYPIPLSEIESRDVWEGEIHHTKRDGNGIIVVSRWTKIRDHKGELAGWLEINTDITSRKNAEVAARALSGRILTLQDEERRRIARGLHDSLGQYLAALKMNLNGFSSLTPPQASKVSDSLEIVERCLSEIRTVSHLLHPPLLDELGFGSAARWYVDGFSRRSGIAVNLDLPQEPVRLHPDVEIALFRAVQESLTNIHKHANSSVVDIRMTQDARQVRLEIQDDGQGIPKERLKYLLEGSAEVGVGIAGVRERFRELGGSLELRSTQKGTTVIVTAPVPRDSAVGSTEDSEPKPSVSAVSASSGHVTDVGLPSHQPRRSNQ
jgi:PAS domain S-box-containing protein